MSLSRKDVTDLREVALDKDAEASDMLELAETAERASIGVMRGSRDVTLAADFEETAHRARLLAAHKAELRDHAAATADDIESVLDQTEGYGPDDPRWDRFWKAHDNEKGN